MNAVCLVIDRLHVGYLGAYGNTWIRTPSFDRLAADGFVFDQAWIDSPSLDRLCRSWWTGRHAMEPETDEPPASSFLLSQRGVRTVLMTDDPAVAHHPLAVGFSQVLELEAAEANRLAPDMEQTHLARCFARLIEFLESAESPFLLWCHLRGLAAPWDAPAEFRLSYVDTEDPPPPETSDVPNRLLPVNPDPDEILGISQAYAGQVSLLDECWGALREFLIDSPIGGTTLLALASARGFPLGEHRRIGPCDDALHSELVHVPLLLRFPDGFAAGGRSQAFVLPADLCATVLDWSQASVGRGSSIGKSLLPLIRGEAQTFRDRLAIVSGEAQRAILTPAWYLRSAEEAELFVHPDDFWQANDVADRCPEVVDLLRGVITQYERTLQRSPLSDFPKLDEILITGLE